MSEESLRTVLSRVASDEEFASYVRENPIRALAEFDLTTVELFALSCADEDALLRLMGSSEEAPAVEFSVFNNAVLPAFDEEAKAEYMKVDGLSGGSNTTKETSHTVTVCCWP
jgi:hypothetical protein